MDAQPTRRRDARHEARRGRVLLCGLLAAALSFWACEKQDQIGAITQYQRGAGDGGGDGQTYPQSGVITLKALYAGAQLGQGEPRVGQFGPPEQQGQGGQQGGAAVTTPVVAIFSESMDMDTINDRTFTLTGGSGGGGGIFGGLGGGSQPVGALVAVDPTTMGRVAVLLPKEVLLPGTSYTATLAPSITDLEGNPLAATEGSDVGGASGTSITFRTASSLDQPFEVIGMYPPPEDTSAPVDTLIYLYLSMPVPEGAASEDYLETKILVSLVGSTGNLAGKVEIAPDPRVVSFDAKEPFPQGATVRVRMLKGVKSAQVTIDGQVISSTLQQQYEAHFTVNSVPVPTQVKLVDNQPLTVEGAGFDGRLTQENLKSFKAGVRVPSSGGGADAVTLLFFQQKGAGLAAARAFKQENRPGLVDFDVNLGKGGEDAAFVDTRSLEQVLQIGAFASRGKQNSPVGPADLPRVFVKTSLPEVTLGPPAQEDSPYELRTVLAEPAIYGTASEQITFFRAVVNGTSFPSTFEALPLAGTAGVADEHLFLITGLAKAVFPGTEIGSAPRYLPLDFDEVRFQDFIGNQVIARQPETGALYFEGSIGGPISGTVKGDLLVRVVREDTLLPLKNATVRVTGFPYNPLQLSIKRSTGGDGEAAFSHAELFAFGPHVMLTADKGQYDLFTLAGFENPGLTGKRFGVSVVLSRTDETRARVTIETQNDVKSKDQDAAFLAAASGVGRPAASKQEKYLGKDFSDERFFLDQLPGAGATRASALLNVEKNRPQVISTFEHDGQASPMGAYVFYPRPVEAFGQDATLALDYKQAGANVSHTLANTMVTWADVQAAGITDSPPKVTRGRLVGAIPGLCGLLPLSFSPLPVDPLDLTYVTLFAAIPPSLWVNEVAPDLDPAYELLLQPDAGLSPLPPTEALLEAAFRLEVEAANVDGSRLTRHRARLDFTYNVQAVTTPADPPDLPVVPIVSAQPATHPPALTIDIDDGGTPDMVPADSLFRLTLRHKKHARAWTVLLSAEAATPVPGPVNFAFPATKASPFDAPGKFLLEVESIEFDAGQFDFDSFVFSDVERRHRRLSRRALTVNTKP